MNVIKSILVASAFLSSVSLSTAAKLPNIVVILTDDQAYADTSLYPTLTELCSVTPPENLQGRSLVPMLRDPASPGKNVAYTVVTRGQKLGKAIRAHHWRYARWPGGEELYDLRNDSEEHVNLATSGEHSDVVSKMRSRLNEAERVASAQRQRPIANYNCPVADRNSGVTNP